jgi:hypothetical protein
MAFSSVGGRATCMMALSGAGTAKANSDRAIEKLRKVGKFFEHNRRTAEAERTTQVKRVFADIDRKARRKAEEAITAASKKAAEGFELMGEEFGEERECLQGVDMKLRGLWENASEHEHEIRAIKMLFEDDE